MKSYIVLCSTIILGVVIYNMVAGNSDDSVISTVSSVWEQGIKIRTNTP